VGGATGVEIVGAFVELLRSRIRREYPNLNWREVKLQQFLIEYDTVKE
jgi:NADH:ubiquinone reductase (H+-translocating)